MSGFLHRLAAQALSYTAPVRSASRLPFSEPAPLIEFPGDFNALPVAAAQRDEDTERTAATLQGAVRASSSEMPALDVTKPVSAQTTAPHRVAPGQPAAARPHQSVPAPLISAAASTALAAQQDEDTERTAATLQSNVRSSSSEMPALDVTKPVSAQTIAPHRVVPGQSAAARRHQSALAPLISATASTALRGKEIATQLRAVRPEPDVLAAFAAIAGTPDEPRDIAPQALTRRGRDMPRIGRLALPVPLLKPVTVNAPHQRVVPQPAATLAGKVEETTEVHVSIGRIEVTAVHEALPPRRPAPRAAKPMSLQDYLARRGGSR